MYIRLKIFGCILLISYVIKAQDNSVIQTDKQYIQFQSTLQKETANSESDTVGRAKSALHPASLPDWFGSIPSSDSQVVYVFGISDPGMEEEKAFSLARLRAKALFALMTHPQVTNLTENFANEKPSVKADEFITKYENLYKIESSIVAPVRGFQVVDSSFTSFGEAILLVKYKLPINESNEIQQINITVDSYQVERQKQNRFETEERLDVKGSCYYRSDSILNEKFTYSFISLNNLFEIESVFNNEPIRLPYYYYRYTMNDDTSKLSIPSDGSVKLNYGLWKAYSEQVVQKIISLSQPFVVNIRQVGDHYTSENQSLSREVSEASPSFKLRTIYVSNNYLNVDLDYLIKPK